MRSICFRGKTIPVWLVCLLIVPLTVSVVYAASVTTTNYQDLSGEVVTFNTDMTCTMTGLEVEATAVSAAGTDSGTPVEVTLAGADASNGSTVGNYVYICTLEVATSDPDQKYSVELLQDGTEVDTLYVEQDSAGTATWSVTCTFDLGVTSLSGTDVYQLKVLEYT